MGNEQVRIAIIGANGYTGAELLRLLPAHPNVSVSVATSRSRAGQLLATEFPVLTGVDALPDQFQDLDAAAVADQADLAFLCLPHGDAQEWTNDLRNLDVPVIDLSADHRFRDPDVYAAAYDAHAYPRRLAETVYGLVEWNRDALPDAGLVGVPGCYPTSVLLAVLPAVAAGWVNGPIIVDAQSGVTGAGRKAAINLLHAEVSESLRAYGLPRHRHESEMTVQSRELGGHDIDVIFTPHLVPANRGILSTIHVPLPDDADYDAIRMRYERAYGSEPFVHLLPEGQLPETRSVRGGNHCHLQLVRRRPNLLTVISVIDNLVKGAAGQAIQCLNARMGWPETTGLEFGAVAP